MTHAHQIYTHRNETMHDSPPVAASIGLSSIRSYLSTHSNAGTLAIMYLYIVGTAYLAILAVSGSLPLFLLLASAVIAAAIWMTADTEKKTT